MYKVIKNKESEYSVLYSVADFLTQLLRRQTAIILIRNTYVVSCYVARERKLTYLINVTQYRYYSSITLFHNRFRLVLSRTAETGRNLSHQSCRIHTSSGQLRLRTMKYKAVLMNFCDNVLFFATILSYQNLYL